MATAYWGLGGGALAPAGALLYKARSSSTRRFTSAQSFSFAVVKKRYPPKYGNIWPTRRNDTAPFTVRSFRSYSVTAIMHCTSCLSGRIFPEGKSFH